MGLYIVYDSNKKKKSRFSSLFSGSNNEEIMGVIELKSSTNINNSTPAVDFEKFNEEKVKIIYDNYFNKNKKSFLEKFLNSGEPSWQSGGGKKLNNNKNS